MLVYGDAKRSAEARDLIASLEEAIAAASRAKAGRLRHEALVGLFIEASELAQGVADAEFAAAGLDHRSPLQDAAARLLLSLAAAVGRSLKSAFRDQNGPPEPNCDLRTFSLAGRLSLVRAEGFSLYGLYPESYFEAARESGLGPATTVIGLRSIGIGLAAMVAAGLQAKPAISVRPIGHPFRRRLCASAPLLAELGAAPEPVAVVDEGPGLSGSSFAAAIELARQAGVSAERLVLFPSHGGEPGPMGDEAFRIAWRGMRRVHKDPDRFLLGRENEGGLLRTWVEDLVGPLTGPLEDISAGGWRSHQPHSQKLPAAPRFERRKFLARSRERGAFLVKFAGLGESGRRKLAAAQTLAARGFTPAPVGLAHGFLVEPWLKGSTLAPGLCRRDRLAERIASYLACRATRLTPPQTGASLGDLARMAAHNAGEALGAVAGEILALKLTGVDRLEDRVVRIDTDGRMQAWEWLMLEDGRILKTDAVDHSTGHDLIGCQDVGWDIVGAAVEFGFSGAEREGLRDLVERELRRPVDPQLVAALEPCYLAFQLGLWTVALQDAPGERTGPLGRTVARYRNALQGWIEHAPQPAGLDRSSRDLTCGARAGEARSERPAEQA